MTVYRPIIHTQLPWHTNDDDDELFARIRKVLFIILAISSIIIPFIPVPELTR